MRDETAREALLAALDDDRRDAVSLYALGDWFEENGDHQAAACLRWVTRNARAPGHHPRPGKFGPCVWVKQGDEPLIDDPPAQLPEELWLELKGNDEPYEVFGFKSYRSARAAYEALLQAWRALGEPPPDVA